MKEVQDFLSCGGGIQPEGFSEGESNEAAVPLVYREAGFVMASSYLYPTYQQLAYQQYQYVVWQNWVLQQRAFYEQQLMQQQQSYQLSNYQQSFSQVQDADLAGSDISESMWKFLDDLLGSIASNSSSMEVHQSDQTAFCPVVFEDNQGKNLYISVAPGVRINIGEYALWNPGRQNMFLVEYPDETYGLASVDKLLDVDSGQPLADQDFDMYVIGVNTNFLEL